LDNSDLALQQKHFVIQKVKEFHVANGRNIMQHELKAMFPRLNIEVLFGFNHDNVLVAAGLLGQEERPPLEARKPKILTLDIETKPLKVYTFGIRDQYINIEQIIEDWSILAFCAKWSDSDDVIYYDLSKNSDYTKDEEIVKEAWLLINEADILVSQNGIRFDIPKLNGKFEKYKLGPPSPFKHVDTYRIKKKLGLTSNKLEYSTEYYNERFKKLKHSKFPGFSLWTECLKGNEAAWSEMRSYCCNDVRSTEELYMNTLRKWDNSINFGAYMNIYGVCPNCGESEFYETGHQYSKSGAFMTYKCKGCGSFSRGKDNLLKKSTVKGLMK
jgi:DNA polymerase elongation subunit (family B)/predicted RNA-binding Zn-ribbon protein involved in translation (DUF1610 family)